MNPNNSDKNLNEILPEKHRHICMKCNVHRGCNKIECKSKYWLACESCLNQNLPSLL